MKRRLTRTANRWRYPLLYLMLAVISMLPPYAARGYPAQETQQVILSLLMVSVVPFAAYAPVLHVATLAIVALVLYRPNRTGRLVAGYMGLNYLVIAFTQTVGVTPDFGLVVHTGGMAADLLLGITWLAVAARNGLSPSIRKMTAGECGLALLALLAFWSPYALGDSAVQPRFDPALLLTSPDYGLTYCLTTPVFLFGLILFYPNVNALAYRLTAYTGLLYGLFNLSHWVSPDRYWMGVMHLPLLILSAYALLLPRLRGSEKTNPGITSERPGLQRLSEEFGWRES